MPTPKIDKSKSKKQGTSANRPATGKNGAPRFTFDPKQVGIFGMYSATYETMATYFGVSIDTIRRNMQDSQSDFCKSYKKGTGMLLMKLREAQVQKALSGDTTMLIWLGKQLLEQRDNVHNKVDLNQPIKLIVDEVDLKA